MKKFVASAMAAAMAVSLAACGGTSTSTATSTAESKTESTAASSEAAAEETAGNLSGTLEVWSSGEELGQKNKRTCKFVLKMQTAFFYNWIINSCRMQNIENSL